MQGLALEAVADLNSQNKVFEMSWVCSVIPEQDISNMMSIKNTVIIVRQANKIKSLTFIHYQQLQENKVVSN